MVSTIPKTWIHTFGRTCDRQCVCDVDTNPHNPKQISVYWLVWYVVWNRKWTNFFSLSVTKCIILKLCENFLRWHISRQDVLLYIDIKLSFKMVLNMNWSCCKNRQIISIIYTLLHTTCYDEYFGGNISWLWSCCWFSSCEAY